MNAATPYFASRGDDMYSPTTTNRSDAYAHQNQRGSMNGLDSLSTASEYIQSMRQMDHANKQQQRFANEDEQSSRLDRKSSAPSDILTRQNSGPVRRRISRACDMCNSLRTKCSGDQPCTHCVEFGLTCEYARERKKRGKASRKDLAAQQVQSITGDSNGKTSPKSANEASSEDQNLAEQQISPASGLKRRRSSSQVSTRPRPRRTSTNMGSQRQLSNGTYTVQQMQSAQQPGQLRNQEPGNNNMLERHASIHRQSEDYHSSIALATPQMPLAPMTDQRLPFGMGDFQSIDEYHRNVLQHSAAANGQHLLHGAVTLPSQMMHGGGMPQYQESPYNVPSPHSQGGPMGNFRMGESPASAGFLGASPNAGSPGWLALPSPSGALYPGVQQSVSGQALRYPVLKPILPRISSIIPISLACDLLELYFASSSKAFMQPASPYILGFLLRKRSVLRQNDARPCSQALLASMLWVAAQTSESSFLTSPVSQRGKICHQLLELTVSLLNPLIHTTPDGSAGYGVNSTFNGVALGGFGMANPAAAHDMEGGSTGATAGIDDVLTYINLATVVSASEYKSASLRWWNAAWSLARELKFGRELAPDPEIPRHQDGDASGEGDGQHAQHSMHPNMPRPILHPEEEREERRRIWWLLYTVDRHLALCYNRPLFLLDVECDGLLQPENDAIWQAGDYYPPDNHVESRYFRRRGPSFECTGHSIFGYFLPLMTILGEIVDLNHARNHPRFGLRFRSGGEDEEHANEIAQRLDAYGRSLKDFEAQFVPLGQDGGNGEHNTMGDSHRDGQSPSMHSTSTSSARMTEAILQTKIVVAYGTHLMHTLHILLNGKWDPISLLDDNDLWISSQSFITATGHAVSAAEAIGDILEYDPDLSFMPFFFGIYLLQGSFLLLLIADKLQGEASPSVVKACETIVRAHEVCVVTLNTEYQRNFRKVMRSALSQVRGRIPEDFGEQQQRRREVLALYRWTGDGSGLAL